MYSTSRSTGFLCDAGCSDVETVQLLPQLFVIFRGCGKGGKLAVEGRQLRFEFLDETLEFTNQQLQGIVVYVCTLNNFYTLKSIHVQVYSVGSR